MEFGRPVRAVPIWYFALAHLALAAACVAVALDPRGVAGFFYHARMLAIVHLVTLGWITASVLGLLYLAGPIALRISVPQTWVDYVAFASVATGIVGMIGHFWIEEYAGMAWSGIAVGIGIAIVGVRVLTHLVSASLPGAVKAHIALAFLNLAGAAALGVLVGFDKVYQFLPGYVLAHVFAHAHLAAIGWASMIVVGVTHTLLPGEMPAGRSLWWSAVLLETGVTGLFIALLQRSRWTWAWAVLIVAGFAAFLAHVVWAARRTRRGAPAVNTADPAVLHAAAAFTCLVTAAALGLWLSAAETTDTTLRVALAYGVLGLVGFLGQIIVSMERRLMAAPTGQELIFVLWLFGVPTLTIGFAFDLIPFVRAAAWVLLAATALDSITVARSVRATGAARLRGTRHYQHEG